MPSRKQITIIYSYNEGWIGGTYYIQSLIQALNILEDARKPMLIILCNSDEEFKQIENTGYPYLKKWENSRCNFEGNLTMFDRIINKLSRTIIKKNIIQKPAILNYPESVDVLFPVPPEFRSFKEAKANLFWIPDFQEIHLPQFFDATQLKIRHTQAAYVARAAAPIVFSSEDVLHDFMKLYPDNRCKKFVVPFAVTHPDYRAVDIKSVLEKFRISTPYFFAPNQFWAHKNHITLIKAARYLAEEKNMKGFQVVFSGKEDDFRNPGYTPMLKKYVEENNLSEYVRFLGFIDRKEQLAIMHHALAVVQPSLFEGWSTVIEDAKAMNHRIIASDLAVNLEQLANYKAKLHFKRLDEADLASALEQMLTHPFERETKDYNENRLYFARQFMQAVDAL